MPQVVREMTEAHPSAKPAEEFLRGFSPIDGVDYSWIVEHAKWRYDFFIKVFDDLDSKATGLIASGGSGTGIITVGSIIAATSPTVSPWIVLAAIPAIIFAYAALLCSIHARAPVALIPAMSPDKIIGQVHASSEDAKKSQARMIPQWHLCTAIVQSINVRKAKLIENATWYFAVALTLLGLPLLVCLAQRFFF